MSDASRRVRQAVMDARSSDDLVRDDFDMMWDEGDSILPLDEETLDEQAATQMGERWESRRRDAD